METNTMIQKTEDYVLHTYNRYQIVFEKGEGVYLYDSEGKKYLDFAAGIGVNSLGYGNPKYKQALKDQIDSLTHISNLFYNEPLSGAAEKLVKATGLSKAFFTNSGTEAIEGALKAAKKYAYTKGRPEANTIIAMEHSFHGRSVGALSVTGNEPYRKPFIPLMPGAKFAEFNNIESVKALADENTCAIILETLQGEGGIYPADEAFIKDVRALCDEKDIVLIIDEVQCGMGRTGWFFAYQKYGIKPDIVTCAKALGCGVPVGAFVLNEKMAASTLVAGDHGSTYGGNPLVCRAVSTVFDLYEEENVIENVKTLTPVLEAALDSLVDKYDIVKGRRGMGFMQGLIIDPSVKVNDIILKALEEGLIVISAEGNVLRFLPPLIISKDNIEEMLIKLSKALA